MDYWHFASYYRGSNLKAKIAETFGSAWSWRKWRWYSIIAQSKGYEVFVSDFGMIQKTYKDVLLNNEIQWEEGGHNLERILKADVVMKSPGIPSTVPVVKAISEAGIDVVSEIEFASWFTSATLVGITGSNGKTTTASLTYALLKSSLNVGLSGNIGDSFAKQL